VHQLDSVGARILQCCDGSCSVDDIVAALLLEFDVDEQKLTADVAALLGKMRRLKIVK